MLVGLYAVELLSKDTDLGWFLPKGTSFVLRNVSLRKANVTCSCYLEMVMGWVWGDSMGEVEPEPRPGLVQLRFLWALSWSRTKPLT